MRYEIFSKDTCPILNLCNAGYASDPAVTRFGPGVRRVYILHYVVAGKGYFNGHPVKAGQGFLITPNMPEQYFPDEKSPWEFVWFVSDDEKMASVFALFGADKTTRIFNYRYLSAARELAESLKKQESSIVNAFELLEMFLRVFKHQQNETTLRHAKTNAETYIEAAVKYIHSHIHTPLSVTELTDFLGVSQPYLYKLFTDRFSKSPKQYILDEKITLAQKFLKETDMSVTHIANSVGFQDALSFSKFFKTQTGLSPQNYRNAIRHAMLLSGEETT